MAIDHEPDLEALRAAARFLVPYAVEVRYPFAGDPPLPDEARDAVQHAQSICDRIETEVEAEA